MPQGKAVISSDRGYPGAVVDRGNAVVTETEPLSGDRYPLTSAFRLISIQVSDSGSNQPPHPDLPPLRGKENVLFLFNIYQSRHHQV